MKKEYTFFDYLIGPNKGVWVLILVHLAILVSLVAIFSAIIGKMQGF